MGQVLRMERGPREPSAAPEAKPKKLKAHEVRAAILDALPGTQTEIARALGRHPSDRTVRSRLRDLEAQNVIESEDGQFRLAPEPEPEPVELPEAFAGYEFPPYFDRVSQQLLVVKLDELKTIDWTTAAIELLESYVSCLQRSRRGHEALLDGEFAVGQKSGRVYAHPAIKVIEKADSDGQKYRLELQKLDEKGGGGGKQEAPSLF